MSAVLKLGSFTPSVLLSVARTTGRLAAHDVEVEEVAVSSSPGQFRSLAAGDLDLALTSPDNVLAYRFDPGNPMGTLLDVRILSTLDRGLGLGLYCRPGAQPASVSAQWVFGVDVPTSGFALVMYAAAERLGIARADLRVVTLGSTPNRRKALVAGDCDATMLNAGNELLAAAAGCQRLVSAWELCSPYVGTVVCVHGDRHAAAGRRLSRALQETAVELHSGALDDLATRTAADVLGIPEDVAARYVAGLKDPKEGLITDSAVDLEGLATIVALRRRYLPAESEGRDVLEGALRDSSGLIMGEAAGP